MTLLSVVNGRGLAAARPAVGDVPVGSQYYSTDTGALERNSGVAWETIAPTSAAPSGAAGGVLSGTYPNPGFASDMATQAELDAEAATRAADDATNATAIADHIADATAAHAATAIAFTPAGTIAATTVQAAIEEVASEAGSGAALTVQEEDGTPSDAAVTVIKVPNGWLIDNGVGDVSLTPPAVAIAAQRTVLAPVIDGGGVALTAGLKIEGIEFPWDGVIEQVTLYADQVGSVVLDFWVDDFAAAPPTVADTITAAAKPTLSAARFARDSTLTGWITAFAAGDSLSINIDSVATITRLTVAIKIRRTA